MSASPIIDFATEQVRLSRQRAEVESKAGKIGAKLDNAEFVARAKPELVEESRERPLTAEAEIARLNAALERIAA